MYCSVDPEALAGCYEAIASLDLRPALASIAAPTLVLAGAEDHATPIESAGDIAERIPVASLRVVPGAAHLANVERADAVTDIVMSHLGIPMRHLTRPANAHTEGGEMSRAHIVRDGAGKVVDMWQFKAGGADTNGLFDLMIGELPYLSGPPLHTHAEQADTFYVLEGVLRLQVDDDMIDLEPGDFASVPPGVPHTFDNVDEHQPPVKVLNLMVPGGFDRALEPSAQHRDRPIDRAELRKQHGIDVVGPSMREKLGPGGSR